MDGIDVPTREELIESCRVALLGWVVLTLCDLSAYRLGDTFILRQGKEENDYENPWDAARVFVEAQTRLTGGQSFNRLPETKP